MTVDIAEVISVVFWMIAGSWLLLGELPLFKSIRIDVLWGIESRWGKVVLGLVILAICSQRLVTWQNADTIIWKNPFTG